jgi:hypothetical protein
MRDSQHSLDMRSGERVYPRRQGHNSLLNRCGHAKAHEIGRGLLPDTPASHLSR